MKTTWRSLLPALMLAVLTGCATPPPQPKLHIEQSKTVTITATVEAIDLKARKVTLRGEQGRIVTVYAGEEVVNLPQVRVGDRVELDFIESLTVRMAKPEEMINEISAVVGTAEPGAKPALVAGTEATVTAAIMAIDTVRGTATLQMPDRSIMVIKARKPENLKKVAVGDTIVINYAEALAIAIKAAR